jgi:starch synthase
MRIVYASSEAVPFAKTGGLADVAGGLTGALAALGHDVTLMLPLYTQVQKKAALGEFEKIGEADSFWLNMGGKHVTGNFVMMRSKVTNLRVVLVDCPQYYDRSTLYGDKNQAYSDNCERYCFFSRAVMEWVKRQPDAVDIIHSNDWQTGLIPALVKLQLRQDPKFQNTASLYTIHNMNFQGSFWHWDMALTSIDWSHFTWREMEFFGQLNLLKTGIIFTEKVSTVSPTYAREIQTPEFGCGLENALKFRSKDLTGILNGIDHNHWNPGTDKYIPGQYTVDNFSQGKRINKEALQRKMGFPVNPDVPLVGMVSRITNQKGFDLIAACHEELFQLPMQFAFLGAGDPYFEELLHRWTRLYPDKVRNYIGYDEELAHLIEAGSDLFLMPSQFEPCGLNQLYSMNYGTLPIVNNTGGLADSVTDLSEKTEIEKTATGFVFYQYKSQDFMDTMQRALDTYRSPIKFQQMIINGMNRDWTWQRSANDYLTVYAQAQQKLSEPQSYEMMSAPTGA